MGMAEKTVDEDYEDCVKRFVHLDKTLEKMEKVAMHGLR